MTAADRLALLVLDAQTWAADPTLPLILAAIPAAILTVAGIAAAIRGAIRYNGRRTSR